MCCIPLLVEVYRRSVFFFRVQVQHHRLQDGSTGTRHVVTARITIPCFCQGILLLYKRSRTAACTECHNLNMIRTLKAGQWSTKGIYTLMGFGQNTGSRRNLLGGKVLICGLYYTSKYLFAARTTGYTSFLLFLGGIEPFFASRTSVCGHIVILIVLFFVLLSPPKPLPGRPLQPALGCSRTQRHK